MPDAYIKFRAGGGHQKVSDYDYVLDTRRLIESGTYRDSGFVPSIIVSDAEALDSATDIASGMLIGYGSQSQFANGVTAEVVTGVGSTTPGIIAVAPDEMMHAAPRQLSYYETSLSFFADSDVAATFTASNSSSRTLLTVADTSLFAGRPVLLSGADLPSATYPYQIYYPVALSSTTMLLQTTLGGDYVAYGDSGTGTLTVTVLDQLASFMWSNILGYSNNAPSR
jgi:hypothetical protein